MPELPEVEVVRQSLLKNLKSQMRLSGIEIFVEKLRFAVPKQFLHQLKDTQFLNLRRVGKFLIFEFEGGKSFFSHLGMTGKWVFVDQSQHLADKKGSRKLHRHLTLTFQEGDSAPVTLHYDDVRRFGFIEGFESIEAQAKKRAQYGPDPLEPDWDFESFKASMKKSAAPIKSFLLDQKKVFGIGNIYASEILFQAGVRPTRAAQKVTKAEAKKIWLWTKKILARAITAGGSSIKDFSEASGTVGRYQQRHLVYGRGGKACQKCSLPLRLTRLAGRSTYWCSHCQK